MGNRLEDESEFSTQLSQRRKARSDFRDLEREKAETYVSGVLRQDIQKFKVYTKLQRKCADYQLKRGCFREGQKLLELNWQYMAYRIDNTMQRCKQNELEISK